MKKQDIMKNDILIASYFMNKYGWKDVYKSNFQRVLYFATVLAPVFLKDYNWGYDFYNTIFGPYNNEIKEYIGKLSTKGLIKKSETRIYSNRTVVKYNITIKGIESCEKVLFRINDINSRIKWFEIIIKVLSIYGNDFMSRLVKQEPNIVEQGESNFRTRLVTDNSDENMSKMLYDFLKSRGKEKFSIDQNSDEENILLFFEVLYRKYIESRG